MPDIFDKCRRLWLPGALMLLLVSTVSGQILMTNGSFLACGGVFMDPGGMGNYSNGATMVMTLNPTHAGDGICLDFTTWELDYNPLNFARLSFYDGIGTGAPLMMTATGDWTVDEVGTAFDFNGPGMVCANGPITIEWDPEGTAQGWEANISCFTPVGTVGCNVTASATNTLVCVGDPVNLSAAGNMIHAPLRNDFNASTIGTGWNATVNARFDNPCGPGPDGTPHLWMGTEPAPRSLSSQGYDVSLGGTISFDLKMATHAAPSPCEGPDETNEGVYLQYSTDAGITWNTIHYFYPPFYTDGSQHLLNWQNYVFNIPPAAQTASTAFRWIQHVISSNSTDHWGLDNVTISLPGSSAISWDQGLGAGTGFTVNPTVTTTYTATISDGTTSCQDQVTIAVNNCNCVPPVVTITHPAMLCEPATYNLSDAVSTTVPTNYYYHISNGNAITNSNPVSQTVSASGTYWVRAEDANDPTCFTIEPVTVNIHPLEEAGFTYATHGFCLNNTDPSPAINGTPGGTFTATPDGIAMNGNSGAIDLGASNPGTYNITYTTPGVCFNDSTFEMTLTATANAMFGYDAANYCINGTNPVITITGSAGVFSATPGGLTVDPMTGAIDLAGSSAGTYIVNNHIAASGPCAAVNHNVTVTVIPPEDPGFVYLSSAFCTAGFNPSPIISGTGGGNFTVSPAGMVMNGITGEIDLAASATGTYNITYTPPGVCFDDSTVQVTLTSVPSATFAYDANAYCLNGNTPVITFSGTVGTFSAIPAGLALNPNTGAIDLSSSVAGTYTIVHLIAASGGCPAISFNTTVMLMAQPDAPTVTGNNIYCEGDLPNNLVANGTGSIFNWYSDSVLNNLTGSGSTFSPGILAPGLHTFFVVETVNGCIGHAASVTLTVHSLPTHNGIVGDAAICTGDTATLTSSGTGVLSWSVNDTVPEISVAPVTDTWYSGTYTNHCGSITDSILVVVHPLPIANAGPDVTISLGNGTVLNGSGGSNYYWTPDTHLDCNNCASPFASPTATTIYFLTVTNIHNCRSTDRVTATVTVDDALNIFIPNIFSPNGDGNNDVLYVRGKGILSIEFLVYDRWGKKVFESTRPEQGWNGTFRGKAMNKGVYAYYIRAMGYHSLVPTELKGNVTLIR